MKQRTLWSAVLVAGLMATAGCGSAAGPGSPAGGSGDKLVVWDWKSGDAKAAGYVEKAKADFAKKHPGVDVQFVAQPFDQYYTLLGTAIQSGKGPDVILFNGGGQIRDRSDALAPLDSYVAEDRQRLAGWEAFSKAGKVYAAPVTLQGHPFYYNKDLYQKAGLNPDAPAKTWADFVKNCGTITEKTGAKCFALGNKEGYGIQFFLSAMGSATLTAQEYDDWVAGKRNWTSPDVKRIFELWKEAGDSGLNNDGVNSTAMFNDEFALFQSGKAANVIGLMSDVGHWKDFAEFIAPDKIGVMQAPVVNTAATPSRGPGALADLDRRPEDLLRRRGRHHLRHLDRRVRGRPVRQDHRLRGQGGQACPARRAVVEDAGPHGQALPAAAQRVDHRRRRGGAAGRLRHDGMTDVAPPSLSPSGLAAPTTGVRPQATAPPRRNRVGSRAERLAPLVLVAPAVLVIVVLRLWPLLLGINFSFTGDGDRNGTAVGLDNYLTLLDDPLFRTALGNVGLLVLLLPVAVAIPGLLATFIHLKVPGHRLYRGVYFFPAVLSPVIVGAIFTLLLAYDGPLNSLLGGLGIGPVDWLGDPDVAIFAVVGVHVWATFGMALVVFLAGFATLDSSLLDAAKVDGASLPQTIRHVIVPGLSRTIQFVFITTMIGMLTSMFGLLFVMTSGGPEGSTYLPEYYIWTQQGQMNRPALASAASTALFLIMLVVGLAQIAVLRRAAGKED